MRIVIRRILWCTAPILVVTGISTIAAGDAVRAEADPVAEQAVPPSEHRLPPTWTPEDVEPFQGDVAYVVEASGVLALADGTTVALAPQTEVDREGPADLASLASVHRALENGWRVRVRGEGLRDSERAFTATALHAHARVGGFDGRVEAVDPSSGGLTLDDGSHVRLTDGTRVMGAGGSRLSDPATIGAALAADDPVHATGAGYLLTHEGEAPAGYQALSVSLGGVTR